MMMLHFFHWLWRVLVQKILLTLFFLAILRTFRIVFFHFKPLFRRQLRQMPNEEHEFPTIHLATMSAVVAAKSGHSRKSHAIFYNPEKFAIGEFLRMRIAQIRRFRIHSPSHHRIAASIIPVANRTVICKVQPCVALHFRRIYNWTRFCPCPVRNRQMPRLARNECFQPRRSRPRAQPVMQNPSRKKCRSHQHDDCCHEEGFPSVHDCDSSLPQTRFSSPLRKNQLLFSRRFFLTLIQN